MTEKRNNLFDLLRVLFAVSVVVTHTSGTIYNGGIESGHVAVEGFFMLSGLFMAKHLYFRKNETADKLFFTYNLGRIKRLFPMYAISCCIWIFKDLVFSHKFDILNWPALYFLGDINGIPGFSVTWYVSVLFWGGLIVSAFLIWQRKVSVLLIFPLIFFISFSFMYTHYENYWLLIKGFLSMGLLRSVCGLCVGAEVFYISEYLKTQKEKINLPARKIFTVFCEILFVYGFASSFWIWFNLKSFLVYLYVPLILLVILLDEQVIFKIFNKKFFSYLGNVTYAVYLTHMCLLKVIAHIGFCKTIPPLATYSIVIFLSFLVGFFFWKIEKYFIRLLRCIFIKK